MLLNMTSGRARRDRVWGAEAPRPPCRGPWVPEAQPPGARRRSLLPSLVSELACFDASAEHLKAGRF